MRFPWSCGRTAALADQKTTFSQANVTDAHSLARAANNVLREYITVHDAIFGGSLWKSIRRALPIPGIFEPIPYTKYQETLLHLREELDRVQTEASDVLDRHTNETAESYFLQEFVEYCSLLGDSLAALQAICAGLAKKAEGAGGPSMREYKLSLNEYDRVRAAYVSAGARLNAAYSTMQRA